ELGVHQVVLPPPAYKSEFSLVEASAYYLPILRTAVATLRPSFIYERICLGNYCGAQISRELGIPYIVEYNGSETAMAESFGGAGHAYTEFYTAVEHAAFAQATLISVASEPIKEDLVRRGIPASKILVNPNATDVEVYKSATKEGKADVRREL